MRTTARHSARSLALAAMVLAAGITSTGFAQPAPEPHHPNVIVPQILRRHWPNRHAAVELAAVNASVHIADQVGTTTLELTLSNPSSMPQEAQLIMPVPEGVAMRSLQYDGVGSEPKAEILPREEARRIYESIVRGMKDPALVEFVGMSMIRTSAFPIPPNSSQKLRLTYEQVLPIDAGRVDYVIPRAEAFAADGVAWSLTADVSARSPIASVYSSSHDVVTERLSPTRVRVRMDKAPPGDRGSLRLSYLLENTGQPMTATVFAYPSTDVPGGNGGYFLLLASPPASIGDNRPAIKREVVVVIDRSGSMRGDKMKQAREAAIQVVRGLDEGEAFNIIDYSDNIASFAEKPVVKTRDSAKAAEAYIASLQANGGTNIHDALSEALRTPATPGMLPITLFLTDGLPTVGERSEVRIREAAKAMNKDARRLFTFGVGFDVNTPLLVALAMNSRAASTFVLPDEDVEVKVSQVFRRLSGPVMERPRISAPDQAVRIRLRELLPAELPDVFQGDQLVVLGTYSGDQPIPVRVSGSLAGRDVSFETTIEPSHASARNGFVPRLWATRKVASLVDEVRQAGAEGVNMSDPRMKELVDEVVRLSVQYGILTEYTAFLAREDTGFTRDEQVRLRTLTSEGLARRAAGERAGAAGFSQQLDFDAKNAAANAPAASAGQYLTLDAAGRAKAERASNIQQLADRTFYNRENRWVDSSILDQETQAPDETVDFGSAAYFALAADLAAQGRQAVLAQRGEVYLLNRSKRILGRGPE